jgi:phosphatidylglycerol:prolipoprotein diacylglycerol transferase
MEPLLGAISWRVVPTIDIGPLSVSPHGLGIAVGYLLGGMLTARRAERLYNISRQHIWNALTWAVVGVIVGARLFFVVGHLGDYIPDDPLGIFRIWEGGIVFYGGVFGGIAAAIPYLRRNGIPIWQAMDAAAPGFPLGLIFGRIGDLVIGDHLGGPTTLPWGFRYAGGQLPGCPAAVDSGISCPVIGEVVHQTALYDLASALVLFPVVLLLTRRRRFDGFLIMFTATWYAIARYISDFARSAPLYAGFRGTQWVSLVLGLSGIWWLTRGSRFGTISPPLSDEHPASVARAREAAAPQPDEQPIEESEPSSPEAGGTSSESSEAR